MWLCASEAHRHRPPAWRCEPSAAGREGAKKGALQHAAVKLLPLGHAIRDGVQHGRGALKRCALLRLQHHLRRAGGRAGGRCSYPGAGASRHRQAFVLGLVATHSSTRHIRARCPEAKTKFKSDAAERLQGSNLPASRSRVQHASKQAQRISKMLWGVILHVRIPGTVPGVPGSAKRGGVLSVSVGVVSQGSRTWIAPRYR